jgi:hypothetical protein
VQVTQWSKGLSVEVGGHGVVSHVGAASFRARMQGLFGIDLIIRPSPADPMLAENSYGGSV